jgi:hypothetical protein
LKCPRPGVLVVFPFLRGRGDSAKEFSKARRKEVCKPGGRSGAMDFVKDLWGFLKVRKKFWLLPIILTLLFFGALMVFASGSAIAPFIYTIF